MDFNFVTDHVATGPGIGSADDVAALLLAGVTHVIDCRDDMDDSPLLAGHFQYLWNPTPDDGQPKPVEWFHRSLAFALPVLGSVPQTPGSTPQQRPRVYAHCAAGVNRGPSTAYAILLALDWPHDLAEQRIRQARPQVGLRYKDDAVKALTALGY